MARGRRDVARDPSNRVSGKPAAVALGRSLFFEPRCRRTARWPAPPAVMPALDFSDGKSRGRGFAPLDRNTPSVLNAGLHRWFGWDGAQDNLWAQSVRPLLDRREMGASPEHVAGLLRSDAQLARGYAAAFGAPPGADDEALTVDAGKALAAYQETLVSARTPFDAFRDALARGDRRAAARYPPDAQRGLRFSSAAATAPSAISGRTSRMASSATSAFPTSSLPGWSTKAATAAYASCARAA
ncbi:MAG: cytochrome-c peroxidase [Betaproteobacteria bacterium]|nr:cytochrome-c peroxidase [Betaproteobacteria bacterium]